MKIMGATFTMTTGEAELVETQAPGSVASGFEELYLREYSPMVRLARGLVDTTERAEEIVQDAFAQVLDKWGRVDEPGGYLRTAVVNGARSELRKREVRRRVGLERPQLVDQGERDYLVDALSKLPPKRKTALVLRYYADLPEKEIAAVMGVRPGTVKSLLSRGIAELREVIEK